MVYVCVYVRKSCSVDCTAAVNTPPLTGVAPRTLHPPDGNAELLCKPLRGELESKRGT